MPSFELANEKKLKANAASHITIIIETKKMLLWINNLLQIMTTNNISTILLQREN